MPDSKLDDLREEINSLDSQILTLFQERAEKVAQIRKIKGGESAWRPAREAKHLRDLCQEVRRAGGALTEQRVRRIWRAIYNDSVASQAPLTIYAEAEHEIASRGYFGNAVAFSKQESTGQALDSVASGDSSAVAVIGLHQWQLLVECDGLFVHEALRDAEGKIASLLIAKRVPEPSGQDLSLVAIRAEDKETAETIAYVLAEGTSADDAEEIEELSLSASQEDTKMPWFLLRLAWWCPPESFEMEASDETSVRYLGVIPEQGESKNG